MFKVGQVWRSNYSGHTYRVESITPEYARTIKLSGRYRGSRFYLKPSSAQARFTLIGNNYKPLERGTTKALPEQRGCRKEDC